MSKPFTWTCEDEEEALGLRTILERSGLHVMGGTEGERVVLRVEGEGAERARALTGRIADHFIDRVDEDRTVRLEMKRRRTDHGLFALAGLAMLGGGLLLTL